MDCGMSNRGKLFGASVKSGKKRKGLRHHVFPFEGKGITGVVEVERNCAADTGISASGFYCSSMEREAGNVETLPCIALASGKRKRTESDVGESSDMRVEQASVISGLRKNLACISDDPVPCDTEQRLLLDWVEKELGLTKGGTEMKVFDQELLDAKAVSFDNNGDPRKSLPEKGNEVDKRNFSCSRQDEDDANVINKIGLTKEDRVLQYVFKRSVVTKLAPSTTMEKTTRTEVFAWGRKISVTVTKEASVTQKWIEKQRGDLFGLDVEWRPCRKKDSYSKAALLQLCGKNDCLIIQLLYLDKMPKALDNFLLDGRKRFAGVGIRSDTNKLQRDYGLVCLGELELTTLAAERMNREDLKHVGLKVLLQQVLGFEMWKPKRVTMSNWARKTLDRCQVEYACMDAWASFAISYKLLSS
eukprot:c23755_g1_i1 orf=208-1455(-)